MHKPLTKSLKRGMRIMDLNPKQAEAVELCLDVKKRLVGVSGEPGTGKTTITKYVYQALVDNGFRVVLSAPTGKAAKRIKEATGIEAITNHRLLEYPHPGERDPKTGKPLKSTDPQRCKQYPLEYDFVIGDEFMMVNREVYQNIINALPSGGCLRCFGDVNQLPPIEKEAFNANKRTAPKERELAPFEEVLKKFDGVHLDQVHRQAEGSGIIANAKAILAKRMPRRYEDFLMKITDRPIDVLRELVTSTDINFGSVDNQIITPTKKSWVGTHELNAMLQPLLNPNYRKGKMTVPERHTWASSAAEQIELYIGDKVIWNDNNDYNLEIFNGESGIITDIEEEFGIITIDFGDRVVEVPPAVHTTKYDGSEVIYNPQKNLVLAYAITTHKSQGSEYNHVVYVLNKSSHFVQNRSNFYTAVTRAKDCVHLISDQKSFAASLYKDNR